VVPGTQIPPLYRVPPQTLRILVPQIQSSSGPDQRIAERGHGRSASLTLVRAEAMTKVQRVV
jgi:hypothetical protein